MCSLSLFSDSPYMHHRLYAVGKQFQHIEQAVRAVIGHRADAVTALDACAEHVGFHTRRVEEQLTVNVQGSSKAAVPKEANSPLGNPAAKSEGL